MREKLVGTRGNEDLWRRSKLPLDQLAPLQLRIVGREEEVALDRRREVDKCKERDSQNRADRDRNPLGGCAKEAKRAG